ncbi:MAG: hypothetical protein CMP59_06765 [Flavobacteriales bacterium]|nr:hypothetical protein [Flavobacteriales bacterium]|tara:strand:+ start:606 stop:2279 length:1674 start_codon:yes stop_codon:yes gene_type:complete
MRTFKLILLICFILILPKAQAGHVAGGEISWECQGNGTYVFSLKGYTFCQNFNNLPLAYVTLQIVGNPLPRSSTNSSFSFITLRPDTQLYNLNSGDISPLCNRPAAQALDCANSDFSMERMVYRSDPLRLNGTPPSNGWKFYWVAPCCRPSYGNYSSGGNPMVGAVMYGNQATNNCYNSSPRFIDYPQFNYCRGEFIEYVEYAEDSDGDSIVYKMDYSYNSPPSAPIRIPYANNYSYDSPTPSSSINSSNQDFTLDSASGRISYKFVNGIGNPPRYFLMNIKVEEYRGSQLLSEVHREMSMIARDCPLINNTHPNNNPDITKPFLKGTTRVSKDTIIAGSTINISLNVLDTNAVNGNPQELRLQVLGQQMSKDYTMGGPCADPTDTTCAYIPSANAVYNAQKDIYEIVNPLLIGKQIVWQTDCSDLGPNNQAKTHRFYMRVSDDFCPLPGVSYDIIEITVLPPNNPPCQLSTSIDESDSPDLDLTIYPNPSNGKVFIDRNEALSLEYQIFNIQGKLMKRGRLAANQHQLELPEAEGLYFVSIRDESGNEKTYKLIKQ